jgi:hypothetical protein
MTTQRQPERAVIKVGEGRGCVVEAGGDYLIITAAHCLPSVPRCDAAASLEERTYQNLLGPLGQAPTVWAECKFIDPIADIAVLGPPDNQACSEQSDAYQKLLADMSALPVLAAPEKGKALLLSLAGNWFVCNATQNGGTLWLSNAAEPIRGGMSGSPVLTPAGACIGVIGNNTEDEQGRARNEGNAACLFNHLPGNIWRDLSAVDDKGTPVVAETKL